ncbi:MAG: DUF2330 domain-containing protein [Polyangia bacterium]
MSFSVRAGVAAAALLCAAEPAALGFCGFFVSGAGSSLYNNASQVVLLRKGNRTVLTMSNNYQGPPEDFAMVVPVPVVLQKENVKTLAPDVFKHIDQLSAPRLVEYWEQDPCYVPPPMKYKRRSMANKKDGAIDEERDDGGGYGVKIEARFEVGEYQIVILSAQQSDGLERWLVANKYKIPSGAAAALAPYIRDQMKFFVAKVDAKKVHKDSHGYVVLSPLRFAYDAQELRLPVRLGLLNAPQGTKGQAPQDLIVYVLHPDKRFEVANYKNAFIPSNLEVRDSVRRSFGAFYAELFDETLRRSGGRAVLTEYAWQTTSCDPCPTPPLSPGDILTLGGDEVGEGGKADGGESSGYWNPAPWVLTRLHTRYSAATLSDDLIFRAAPPVYGGRADWSGGLGDQGATVQSDGTNQFQGRYIIRHCDRAAPGPSAGGLRAALAGGLRTACLEPAAARLRRGAIAA